MKKLLADLVARSGVQAAFVSDEDGGILAAAISDRRYQEILPPLSATVARSNTTLQSYRHGSIAEIEWVYSSGRVLVRGLDNVLICLICTRSINLQLLTMQLEQASDQIRSKLGSRPPLRSPQDMQVLKKGLISIAEDMLGEHAGKVTAILESSGSTFDGLEEACEQAEKVTRLFIDRKNAGELGARLRTRLDDFR